MGCRVDLTAALSAAALALALAACHDTDRSTGKGNATVSLAGARFVQPPADDGQWLMAAKDYANTRFSGLDQITPSNVRTLREAWHFDTGTTAGFEAAPLVIGTMMYVVTPFPNKLFAFDLAKGGALAWTYEPRPNPASRGVACCDVVNRGAAYADGKIIYATLDTQVVAVDAATGAELWRTTLGNINMGESITMAPIIVGKLALVGNSGGEFGVRGWLKGVDIETGTVAWTAYQTGPDEDVLIGPNFRPHYEQDRGTDLGVTTWPAGKWKQGGGTVWGWLSYDPALDLVYHGTANPGPWNATMRPGDNKWTAGIFARRPSTGEAIWFYQWSPHDAWDHDGVNESILVDLAAPVGGASQQLLLHPERNGYVYVMDRKTGQVLSADPYVHITTSRGVDLETGKLRVVHEKEPTNGRTTRDICPFAAGAKDWNPSAFSPRTGLLYIPHVTMCMDEQYTEVGYIAGTPYVGASVRYYAMPGGTRGRLTAWDPIARKPAWIINEDLPLWSGALATAGGVVFYGTMDGWFKAIDATTGTLLWSTRLPSGIIAQPISYRGPDGKQYIAVAAGVGGWSGAIVSLGLDPRDLSAGNGWGNAMKDLPNKTQPGGSIHVFALPD